MAINCRYFQSTVPILTDLFHIFEHSKSYPSRTVLITPYCSLYCNALVKNGWTLLLLIDND